MIRNREITGRCTSKAGRESTPLVIDRGTMIAVVLVVSSYIVK